METSLSLFRGGWFFVAFMQWIRCFVHCSRIQSILGCNKGFPISMSYLYHLKSWHGDKKSEQCHVKKLQLI